MPALPAVTKVIRVALSGTIGTSHQWLSRFYVAYAGVAPTNANLATFNGAVGAQYGASMQPLAHLGVVLTQIESVDLTSPTSAEATTGLATAGARTGDENPAQIAVVASYKVARRYRGGHPRGYWPLGESTDVDVGIAWTPTALTAFQTALNNFFAGILAAPWSGGGPLTHVNVSYFSGFTVVIDPVTGRARNLPTLRAAPVVDAITSTIVRGSIGTQRRRADFIN